jgi:primosomal protein PriA-like protein
MREG